MSSDEYRPTVGQMIYALDGYASGPPVHLTGILSSLEYDILEHGDIDRAAVMALGVARLDYQRAIGGPSQAAAWEKVTAAMRHIREALAASIPPT